MTETKRFTLAYGKYKDNLTGIEYDEKWESWKICHLLNDLNEENESLKKTMSHYADIAACSVQVMDEDPEMKNDYAAILCNSTKKLIEENKELRSKVDDKTVAVEVAVCEQMENIIKVGVGVLIR